jgi:hypothetical protein
MTVGGEGYGGPVSTAVAVPPDALGRPERARPRFRAAYSSLLRELQRRLTRTQEQDRARAEAESHADAGGLPGVF